MQVTVIADNQANVYVNGAFIAGVEGGWTCSGVVSYNVTTTPSGTYLVEIDAINFGPGDNPAGLVAMIRDPKSPKSVVLVTDGTWTVTYPTPPTIPDAGQCRRHRLR